MTDSQEHDNPHGAEFFVYECSENDGMKSWVETYKDRPEYEELDCETLVRIIGWGDGWPESVGTGTEDPNNE